MQKMKMVIVILSLLISILQSREFKLKLEGNLRDISLNRITIKEIEELGVGNEFRVFEPFDEEFGKYQGVWLSDFIKKYAKSDTKSVKFLAIDKYQVTLTKKEWESQRILFVTRMNGKYIDYKTKGHIRIIYPDADKKHYESKKILDWIWMIKKVIFKK